MTKFFCGESIGGESIGEAQELNRMRSHVGLNTAEHANSLLVSLISPGVKKSRTYGCSDIGTANRRTAVSEQSLQGLYCDYILNRTTSFLRFRMNIMDLGCNQSLF